MLDTNICSFIMREHPSAVIEYLEIAVKEKSKIVVSAITYAEMRYGAIAPKAPKKIEGMVNSFIRRLDAVLPWDSDAIDRTVNTREFSRVDGLQIVDWVTSAQD
jgi:tRNA(fMet)-specific endonuclease VapC